MIKIKRINQGFRFKKGEGVFRKPKNGSLAIYFKEIGAFPLLTKDEEIKLGELLHGKAIAKILWFRNEKRLITRKEATRILIESNLRLVVSVAFHYCDKNIQILKELIQEGNLGLMEAVKKFDYKRGYKFSTFATWWIRQKIVKALSGPYKTSYNLKKLLRKVRKFENTRLMLKQKTGQKPTIKQVAKVMNISKTEAAEISSLLNKIPFLEKISLDDSCDQNPDSMSFKEIIPDIKNINPEEETFRREIYWKMPELLSLLNHNQHTVIQMRFLEEEENSYDNIKGKIVPKPVTRERVRQIKESAFKKLRKQAFFQELAGVS